MPSQSRWHRDAITGNKLKVEQQLVEIEAHSGKNAAGEGVTGVQRKGWNDAANMRALAELLAAPSPDRAHGTHEVQGVLLVAGAVRTPPVPPVLVGTV